MSQGPGPDDDLGLTRRQVRDAQAGDRQALDELFVRYLPRVRALVAARLGKGPRQFVELEDLVQETFADVLAGLDGIRHDSEGLFLHWLARCVENNIRDQLRRGQALKRGGGRVRPFASFGEDSLAESLFAGREDSPSEVLHGRELEDRLQEGMLALGARYREVLSLRIHGGLSFREVAEVMDLPSENTASVLFARARERLRQLVQ